MTNWSADDIPDLEGKTVVITGANSGLGFEASKMFAENNAEVIMACRSIKRGKDAKEDIEEKIEEPNLEVKKLDLADLESVKNFAEEFKANHEQLDILCNNAGVMAIPREETEDGFEKQFGVNHLGHFALTSKLFPALESAENARIVTQSSGLHKKGEIDFDDLMHKEEYNPQQVYSDSKLANLLFAYELDRKIRREGLDIKSVGCHPGYAATSLQTRGAEKSGNKIKKFAMKAMNKVVAQSAHTGALPMMYAAVGKDIEGGDYTGPGGLMNMRGLPEKQESSEASYETSTAEKLWAVSEELTGIDFEL
jgi:NAD(P)-dependent dehydrogenase (short-subunit alcohol dehydrogenase family)